MGDFAFGGDDLVLCALQKRIRRVLGERDDDAVHRRDSNRRHGEERGDDKGEEGEAHGGWGFSLLGRGNVSPLYGKSRLGSWSRYVFGGVGGKRKVDGGFVL